MHLYTSSSSTAQLAVLIPARRYEPTLMPLVDALLNAGFGAVIVVDDGSPAEDQPSFAALAGKHGVYLIRHAVNLGKGRALKTGIFCYLNTFPAFYGLITADADGQHTVRDVVRVGEALLAHPQRAVLGVRSFAGGVPLRSRLGNTLSSLIFCIASGEAVKDTQSGLRGFPSALLAELGALDGERYEYETSVLMHLCRHGHAPLQVPISTIYFDANRSSHFEPMRDPMRIGFVLLRYSVSSLIAAGIDFTVFAAVFWITRSIFSSLIVGRVSSLANFTLNKRFVFNHDVIIRGSLGRYYLLALVIATLSYAGTCGFSENLHWNVLVAKVVSDTILFIASFSIQRTFVFPLGEKE